ncbi:MerR family transcriptional regulator [Candidatus Hepatincola sp. Pdp]
MPEKLTTKEHHTIGEVSKLLNVDQHVIRFWTSKFSDYICPIRKAGLRRYYSQKDIKLLSSIKDLLYDRGFSIKGVLLLLSEKKDLEKVKYNKGNIDSFSLNKIELEKIITKLDDLQNKLKKVL